MFDFNRRTNRLTFLVGSILGYVVALTPLLLLSIPGEGSVITILLGLLLLAMVLVVCVYWLCLMYQRACDIGWQPLLVTIVCFVTPLSVLLIAIPGQSKKNAYGPKPKKGLDLRLFK